LNHFCKYRFSVPNYGDRSFWEFSNVNYFEDHGLPLVQLQEQRRELVMALMGREDPIPKDLIAEIAALQQAIAAVAAVIVDLDAVIEISEYTGKHIRRGQKPPLV
jgi:hypothetical protein